jgi:hypothetical protein
LTHETPIPGHRSGDLGHCRFRPVEQVECTAAENSVQDTISEGDTEGTSPDKEDVLKPRTHGFLSGLAKHWQGEIEPDHPTRSLRGQRTDKQSRTAGQIQDAAPFVRLQPLDQIYGELPKGRGASDEEPQRTPIFLVDCSDWRELHQTLEWRDGFPVSIRQKVQDAIL